LIWVKLSVTARHIRSSYAGLTRVSIIFKRDLHEARWIAGSSPAMTTKTTLPQRS
jgi:hypothetical protein